MSNDALDGNAAAGTLSEIFTPEPTTAVSTCASCGDQSPVGALPAYLGGPGLVLRCAACSAVQIRVASSGDRAWLDLQGISALQFTSTPT